MGLQKRLKLTSKQYLFLLAGLVTIGGSLWLSKFLSNYIISTTPSTSYRIFRIEKGLPKKDDYVIVEVPFAVTPQKVFIKRIACIEGDYLKVKGRAFYCNGIFIGCAKDETLDGKPLEHIYYDGIIPEGYIFVVGDSFHSYDSKYFGLVPKSYVRTKLTPIF